MAATYKVEIGWPGYADGGAGTVRFGVSTFGSADTFGETLGGTLAYPVWSLTEGVQVVQVRRGRQDADGPVQAGELVLTIVDNDGRYNPHNTASPLYGKLLPGRQTPVRVRATYQGTTYALFLGFVRAVEYRPADKQTTIYAQDLMLVLSRIKPTLASLGGTTTGAAIGRVLDAAGWSLGAYRSLAVGDSIPDFSADGTKTGLSLIEDLLAAERGVFFVSAGGVATYLDRYAGNTAPRDVVQTTIAGAALALSPAVSLENVRNSASVTRTQSGTTQTYVDAPSIDRYGLAEAGSVQTPYLNSDDQALALASWIVGRFREPTPRNRYLDLVPRDAATQTALLVRDVQDHVRVTEAGAQTDGEFDIVGVSHTVQGGGLDHRASWVLSRRSAGNPFRIEVSGLSSGVGGDALAY